MLTLGKNNCFYTCDERSKVTTNVSVPRHRPITCVDTKIKRRSEKKLCQHNWDFVRSLKIIVKNTPIPLDELFHEYKDNVLAS